MKKRIPFLLVGLLLGASTAMALTMSVSETITGAGNYTDSILAASSVFLPEDPRNGHLNISIDGASLNGTVTIQNSYDGGTTWGDVETYTAPTRDDYIWDPEHGVLYRGGIKAGELNSGNCTIRLSH